MAYRLYFNCQKDFPLVWSVDQGPETEEIKVADFHLYRVTGEGRYEPTAGDDENSPTAWIEIPFATLEIRDQIAYFVGENDGKT